MYKRQMKINETIFFYGLFFEINVFNKSFDEIVRKVSYVEEQIFFINNTKKRVCVNDFKSYHVSSLNKCCLL
jgi:hypothetical protein